MEQLPPSPVPSTDSRKRSSLKSAKSVTSGKSKNSISIILPPSAATKDFERHSSMDIRSLSPEQRHAYLMDERIKQATSARQSIASRQSDGMLPPPVTLQRGYSQDEIRRIVAARIIEMAWMSFRDRQMFKLLKHAVCAAEHSLSYEILRKVCPKEAELLKDKCLPAKVRFRFAGIEYPPMIFFKIYSSSKSTGGMNVRYVSGKKMIKPGSEAAREAFGQMGARLFYDQYLQDTLEQRAHRIAGEVDVTTLKDYMQYLSLLDETPACMGGRDNSWRKLTLEALPRTTIFYDVVSYLYSGDRAMTPRLQAELPALLIPPITQEVQLQHIQIISALRTPDPPTAYTSNYKLIDTTNATSRRRSRQAKLRVLKMRKVYDDAGRQEEDGEPTDVIPAGKLPSQHMFLNEGDEDWEKEADKLYKWTKDLTIDDMNHSFQAVSSPPNIPLC